MSLVAVLTGDGIKAEYLYLAWLFLPYHGNEFR